MSARRLLSQSFQSTLPGWGATQILRVFVGRQTISIHAPRMGSDLTACDIGAQAGYFNPRSPDGERLISAIVIPK